MTRFDEALRELAVSLDLPEPVRSRMLLELRGDLEAMAEALEARGADPESARRRALESLLPGPESLEELGRVHRPLYRRLVDRFTAAGRHGVEWGLLAVLTALLVGFGLVGLGRFELMAEPSPFFWPVLAGAVAVGVVGAVKLFHLWVAGGRGGLRRGLGLLLGAGAFTLVAAFTAVVADFYAVAGRLAEDASRQLPVLLPWLQREMLVLALALLAASAAGLIWLVAAVRIARIERTEAVALGIIEPRREP